MGHRLDVEAPTSLLAILAAALAGVIALLALVFSSSTSAETIALDAVALQRSEEALSAATASRASTALTVASAQAGSAALDQALPETARSQTDELTRRVAMLVEEGFAAPPVATAAQQYADTVDLVLAAVDRGEAFEAVRLADGRLASTFSALQATVTSARDGHAARIATAGGTAGRLARTASFLVAFLVPASALFLFRRIARRRLRHQELEAALRQEQEVSKAKDEMIGNLSHELKTPLTAIYGCAMTLEDAGFHDPALSAEMTGMIVGEAAELSRMVDDLLAAAKADTDGLEFHMRPVEVADQVEAVLAPMRRRERKVEVSIEPATVWTDHLRLRHVIRNLLSNAFRHGGEEVLVFGRRGDGTYQLVVADDGPGLPEHDLERFTRRFLHEGQQPLLTGSVGLGLSVARTMAEQMGAELVYEHLDGTTMFAVRLPLADGPADRVAHPTAAPAPA